MSLSNGGRRGERENDNFIIGRDDLILVTGATGFVGPRVVVCLLNRGFKNIRCFTRSSNAPANREYFVGHPDRGGVQWVTGNLLSRKDCITATEDVSVILHLAAGRGEKFFPDAFMNSVVTARNLLDACVRHNCLRRFVNVSSFAVYDNANKSRPRMLDETCPIDLHP